MTTHPADGIPSVALPHDLISAMTKAQKHFTDSSGIAPLNQIVGVVTKAYLATLDPEQPPAPAVVEQQLLGFVNAIGTAEGLVDFTTG